MNVDNRLLNAIVAECKKYADIEKVVLFGSRARGDNNERSDYDIAVYGNLKQCDKAKLRLCCEEDLPTLHKIDMIFMNEQTYGAFIENIEKEGIAIYGQVDKQV